MSKEYVVVDGNILGIIRTEQPDVLEILATSPLRGAVLTWMDGTTCVPLDPSRVRPATEDDFADFRVSPRYHLPGAL